MIAWFIKPAAPYGYGIVLLCETTDCGISYRYYKGGHPPTGKCMRMVVCAV
jgi:hypothetical protein